MASRNNSAAKNEIIEELKEDHKRAKQAFRAAEKLDAEEDGEELKAIVDQTCAELEVHAQLEEELFYPAAREALKEADLVDEAEVEHGSAKALIAQLREMSPEDEKYAATFKVLGEYINHHVKEKNEMSPPCRVVRGAVGRPPSQMEMRVTADVQMGRYRRLISRRRR